MNHMTPQSWSRQLQDINTRRDLEERKLAAGCLAALVFLFAAAVLFFDEPRPLGCATDTECAALCDPADELCDGGPQE